MICVNGCKRYRHDGPCEPTEEEMREFFGEMELEKAQELVGRAASASPRLKEEHHEPR